MCRPPSYPYTRYDSRNISEFIILSRKEGALKTRSTAARDALWSGALASLISSAVLSLAAQREKRSPLAPTNASSRWIWGDRAARRHDASLRYTGLGYAIHHVSASFRALVYEKCLEQRVRHAGAPTVLAAGMAVGVMACIGDYVIAPYRFKPGFEQHLSMPSLALSYGGFGLALACHTLLSCKGKDRSS